MSTEVSVRAAKAELRRVIRAQRKARPAAESRRLAQGLVEVATARPELLRAGEVTIYVSLPGEPDTTPLRTWLQGRGGTVWLPIVTSIGPAAEPGLTWALAEDGLAPGAATPTGLRILEPIGPRHDVIRPDVVLLPGLAVDRSGLRLGQGAGYYDRTIQRLGWGPAPGRPGHPLLVAIVHDEEVLDEVPGEPHDARAHAICTPTRWIPVP